MECIDAREYRGYALFEWLFTVGKGSTYRTYTSVKSWVEPCLVGNAKETQVK